MPGAKSAGRNYIRPLRAANITSPAVLRTPTFSIKRWECFLQNDG